MNADLPNHLVSSILYDAELEVDTKLALKMRPRTVKRLVPTESYSTLSKLFETRSKMWTQFVRYEKTDTHTALATFKGAVIPQMCPRETLHVSASIYYIHGEVLMHFEKMLNVENNPRTETYIRDAIYCDVQTGNTVLPFFNDEDEF